MNCPIGVPERLGSTNKVLWSSKPPREPTSPRPSSGNSPSHTLICGLLLTSNHHIFLAAPEEYDPVMILTAVVDKPIEGMETL